MHNNISIEISPSQVENLVERLPLERKLRLVRRLQRETWANRLDEVTQRMRGCIRRARISAKDIDRICEEVKREYDEKHRGH